MIKAEVVKAFIFNSTQKHPGDSVEVDITTFNDLWSKGVLKPEGAKALKIVRTSDLVAKLNSKGT